MSREIAHERAIALPPAALRAVLLRKGGWINH
jgi:hypothetical protein